MLNHLRTGLILVLLSLSLVACGGGDTTEAPAQADLDATVAAGVAATEAAQPTPTETVSPTDTPTPEPSPTDVPPTETPAPTDTPIPEATATPTEIPTLEPLTLTSYTDSSEFFRVDLPESWEAEVSEAAVSATSADGNALALVLALPNDGVSSEDLPTYSEEILAEIIDSDDFTVEDLQSGEGFVALVFTTADDTDTYRGALAVIADEVILYHLVFFAQEDLYVSYSDLFGQIVDSFEPLFEAPAAVDPTATPVPTLAPAPTEPPPPPANSLAPEEGRSRLYVFNEYGEELTFTIDGREIKIPPGTIDDLTPIDLDAGQFTYTISIPFGAVNGEVNLAPNQSWAVGVRGDGAVYEPFQVYP